MGRLWNKKKKIKLQTEVGIYFFTRSTLHITNYNCPILKIKVFKLRELSLKIIFAFSCQAIETLPTGSTNLQCSSFKCFVNLNRFLAFCDNLQILSATSLLSLYSNRNK